MEKKGIGAGIVTAIFGSIAILALVMLLRIKSGAVAVEDLGGFFAFLVVGLLGILIFAVIAIVGGIIAAIFLILSIVFAVRYYSKKKTGKNTTSIEEPKL
jgi:hypothetical protein